MDQIEIGKFIAKCRKDKNITQEQLAKKLNITDKAISKWENGRCMPDISLLKNLCSILEVSINELLSGEKLQNSKKKSEELILSSLVENTNQKKKMSQGTMLLGIAIAFNISTIIFGMNNQMIITFGGITFAFIVAGMITLLKK